jgi:hypothetical protein
LRGSLVALTIGAIGVVYGDIGTSPLYAIDPVFFGAAAVAPRHENVLGTISLAIWTIILIATVKYALLVLRAENDGEGGLFALYGLLHKYKRQGASVLLWLLMLGAGLLLGDGMITPAISVLSALKGLEIVTPGFSPYIIPITAVLLTGLFAVQFKGASAVAVIFGPPMLSGLPPLPLWAPSRLQRTPRSLLPSIQPTAPEPSAGEANEPFEAASASACFCSCAGLLGLPITPIILATQCSFPPRSCRSGCAEPAHAPVEGLFVLVALRLAAPAVRAWIQAIIGALRHEIYAMSPASNPARRWLGQRTSQRSEDDKGKRLD